MKVVLVLLMISTMSSSWVYLGDYNSKSLVCLLDYAADSGLGCEQGGCGEQFYAGIPIPNPQSLFPIPKAYFLITYKFNHLK